MAWKASVGICAPAQKFLQAPLLSAANFNILTLLSLNFFTQFWPSCSTESLWDLMVQFGTLVPACSYM